ncbi:hypothetical protein CEUSTIGMA_g2745.t1 [Chlamydomonas eustigma]|uniref:Glycosyltransferase 2-like domain-containing protein n=1 Tax=Chlamydomonas eustigma TaxID=1157962 RepID=A0A250WXP2_9CHLO|nr:hypothetical protein CEUSTIGMA_g2745.t1 [Chlamydomonas eustigma]|eukprot:GAX75300.1 hypothetical protein CEUSTIGMA_g2745.t1 [Chlamydomonas eustigma]
MWFYLVLGTLFTGYAVDLLWLVLVAAAARSHEALQLYRQYILYSKYKDENVHSDDTHSRCGCCQFFTACTQSATHSAPPNKQTSFTAKDPANDFERQAQGGIAPALQNTVVRIQHQTSFSIDQISADPVEYDLPGSVSLITPQDTSEVPVATTPVSAKKQHYATSCMQESPPNSKTTPRTASAVPNHHLSPEVRTPSRVKSDDCSAAAAATEEMKGRIRQLIGNITDDSNGGITSNSCTPQHEAAIRDPEYQEADTSSRVLDGHSSMQVLDGHSSMGCKRGKRPARTATGWVWVDDSSSEEGGVIMTTADATAKIRQSAAALETSTGGHGGMTVVVPVKRLLPGLEVSEPDNTLVLAAATAYDEDAASWLPGGIKKLPTCWAPDLEGEVKIIQVKDLSQAAQVISDSVRTENQKPPFIEDTVCHDDKMLVKEERSSGYYSAGKHMTERGKKHQLKGKHSDDVDTICYNNIGKEEAEEMCEYEHSGDTLEIGYSGDTLMEDGEGLEDAKPCMKLPGPETVPGLPVNPESWPKVLIQLPMYNEAAHCDLIVQRCCRIRWPLEKLLIQVLDDSTKLEIRRKVDSGVLALIEEGHPVQVLRRDNRQGFKAGAMVEGLLQLEGQGFEYVAIFDADFEPPEDFLEQTVPLLHNDRNLGFVQTRWSSTSTSFLTWIQKVNLDFHFDVEQRARSHLGWFFNFNGTAGVWRIQVRRRSDGQLKNIAFQAIHDAGGWQSDTVVEDMDLSLRCYLNGWTATYLNHVVSPNELPSTLSTYKTQQFRWLSGPMQILVKCFMLIWKSTKISFLRKLNCYWFFMRYVVFALITLGVLSVPPVVLWVDPWDWRWPQIYFLVAINFALAVYLYITPFSMPYLLFSVSIGYFKTFAMLSGLIGSEKSKTWKVTQKHGGSGSGFSWRRIHKPYTLELLLSVYYGGMSAACYLVQNWMLGGYCTVMALLFLALSFGDCFL